MQVTKLAGFKPVLEENSLIRRLMKPFELARDLKVAGLLLSVLIVLFAAGFCSPARIKAVDVSFLFFPDVQKTLGVKIPVTNFLDSTANR